MTEFKVRNKKRLYGLALEATSNYKGMVLSLCGILSVEEFSFSLIVLRLKRGSVIIKGEDINITLFSDKIIEIEGFISEIRFLTADKVARENNDEN